MAHCDHGSGLSKLTHTRNMKLPYATFLLALSVTVVAQGPTTINITGVLPSTVMYVELSSATALVTPHANDGQPFEHRLR